MACSTSALHSKSNDNFVIVSSYVTRQKRLLILLESLARSLSARLTG